MEKTAIEPRFFTTIPEHLKERACKLYKNDPIFFSIAVDIDRNRTVNPIDILWEAVVYLVEDRQSMLKRLIEATSYIVLPGGIKPLDKG